VHFYEADPAYRKDVAKKLGLDLNKYAAWARFSLSELIEKIPQAFLELISCTDL